MKQEEAGAAGGRRTTARVEAGDAVVGQREEPGILRRVLGGRVPPVREKDEVDVTPTKGNGEKK